MDQSHRLGTPASARARRLLLVAMLIDTLGAGLAMPFELLFGHLVVGLPLGEVGLGISIGTAAAIVIGPLSGTLVDRVGPTRVMAAANLTSAIGSLALLVVQGFVPFTVVSFVLASAQRAFWASYAPLVAGLVPGDQLEVWFGRFRGIRYAGIAGGAALASVALLPGQDVGLRLVLMLDALSYIAAMGMLLAAVRGQARGPTRRSLGSGAGLGSPARLGYLAAFRDRTNVVLAAMNIVATLTIIMPLLALPVFVLDQLRLPIWLPGVLAAIGMVATAVPSLFSGRLTRGRPRLSLLALAATLWATSSILFAVSTLAPALWLLLLPAAMVSLGIGEALYAPTADALPLAIAPLGLAGQYTAIHQTAWGVSGTIAPALTVAFLLARPDALWWALAAASGLTALTYLWLQPRVGIRTGIVGASMERPTSRPRAAQGKAPRAAAGNGPLSESARAPAEGEQSQPDDRHDAAQHDQRG